MEQLLVSIRTFCLMQLSTKMSVPTYSGPSISRATFTGLSTIKTSLCFAAFPESWAHYGLCEKGNLEDISNYSKGRCKHPNLPSALQLFRIRAKTMLRDIPNGRNAPSSQPPKSDAVTPSVAPHQTEANFTICISF